MMRITTACLVVRESTPNGHQYNCRPLGDFFTIANDVVLSSAIRELRKHAKKQLETIAKARNQTQLHRWIFDSEWLTKTIDLFLALPDRTVKARLPFVIRPFGARLIAQSPLVPGLNLLLDKVEQLELAAMQLVPEWIMAQKNWRDADWTHLLLPRDHWFEVFEVEFDAGKAGEMSLKNFFKLFAQQNKLKGSQHLQAIGRCLDDELQDQVAVFGREEEVTHIDQLLASRKCQCVAVIGEPGVGKTSVIREVVRRRNQRRTKKDNKGKVWAVQSQRIVTGMMYLGQWEERWLGILREVHRQDHVLFIEDPLGLLTAGKTRDSKLTAADVLATFAAVHPIRIITELTPQAFGILKVRKRELADLFLATKIEPMNQETTMSLMIQRTGEIEIQRKKFFHPGTLPLLISSTDRYFRGQSFPGKVVQVMDDLCRDKTPGIAGAEVMASIKKRTGLQLDRRVRTSSELAWDLKSRVVGQEEALEKLLRFVVRVGAGLQPEDRPLGVFLCLGPTGVGKTETAKAIAEVMFEGAQHLLRFDMNEINSPLAAEQLIGNFEQPDGKLTSAVRRQPFSVILFDEIEKAHPDVFDYLLQVIGEGRLTDAIGRTIDFRDSLILMTSNIGAREAMKSIGFEANDARAAEHYRRAAASFFRPEFINRIDDILIFKHLTRAEIERISHMQIARMIERDGIRRRKMMLRLEPKAMDWLVGRGYDPQLGARVLKRELERYVAQPLADSLAEKSSESHCLLKIDRQADRLNTQVISLPSRPARKFVLPSIQSTLEETQKAIDELQVRCETLRDGCNFEEKLSRNVIQYYALREQITLCQELLEKLDTAKDIKSGGQPSKIDTNLRTPKSRVLRRSHGGGDKLYFDESNAADDIREVTEADPTIASSVSLSDLQWTLHSELEFAKVMLESFHDSDEVFVYSRKITSGPLKAGYALRLYTALFSGISSAAKEGFGFDIEFTRAMIEICFGHKSSFKNPEAIAKDGDGLPKRIEAAVEVVGFVVRGLGAYALAQVFAGLYASDDGQLLLRVGCSPLQPSEESSESRCNQEVDKLLASSDPLCTLDDDQTNQPENLRGVVQGHRLVSGHEVYNSDGLTLTPRVTGLIDVENPQVNNPLRRMILDWLLVHRCGVEVAS
jgi:ATP-dependent Clp protease ATP-binding subunit ClpC